MKKSNSIMCQCGTVLVSAADAASCLGCGKKGNSAILLLALLSDRELDEQIVEAKEKYQQARYAVLLKKAGDTALETLQGGELSSWDGILKKTGAGYLPQGRRLLRLYLENNSCEFSRGGKVGSRLFVCLK